MGATGRLERSSFDFLTYLSALQLSDQAHHLVQCFRRVSSGLQGVHVLLYVRAPQDDSTASDRSR